MTDPTRRFANRVENYIKYRPTYPPALIDMLKQECGLTPSSVIADIGSGTGVLSEMFLKCGNTVFGVEPNREMREAGERLLKAYERFTSVAASAEETTLAPSSVDFVTAAQAFHWFDRTHARREFARILKPGGWVVLAWNDRLLDTTPFLVAYEKLLRAHGTDYDTVRHTQVSDAATIRSFFGHDDFQTRRFYNEQVFDYEGLRGRLLSSSYTPEEGDPRFRPMLAELQRIFELHNRGGKVIFEYQTLVFYGHLPPEPKG